MKKFLFAAMAVVTLSVSASDLKVDSNEFNNYSIEKTIQGEYTIQQDVMFSRCTVWITNNLTGQVVYIKTYYNLSPEQCKLRLAMAMASIAGN